VGAALQEPGRRCRLVYSRPQGSRGDDLSDCARFARREGCSTGTETPEPRAVPTIEAQRLNGTWRQLGSEPHTALSLVPRTAVALGRASKICLLASAEKLRRIKPTC